ncbi:MAG: ribulose-phosphate 3-epimerase [Planctomycetota bacterium]
MAAKEIIAKLRSAAPIIGPSLLASDFAHLGQEIRRLEEAGAQILHLDIMDGRFVPNISFGFPVIEAIRRSTRLPLDVHLMISEPGRYLERFRKVGADVLTIHVETVDDPRPLLREIRRLGAVAGLSLNPPTPIESVECYLHDADLVLVMSVMAGYGGQEFDLQALDRLRHLRAAVGGNDLLLSVDGGINDPTIGLCAEAGADLFVMGSALFGSHDYRQAMEEFRSLALTHKNIRV